MPGDTALSRVRKSEFFAILAPGVYVVSAASLVAVAAATPASHHLPWDRIFEVLRSLSHDWPVAGAGLFFAYLIGSVLRAIPVNVADLLCGKLFKVAARHPFDIQIYNGGFPYSEMLGKQLEALQKNGIAEGVKWPLKEKTTQTVFNYWKATLCHYSPESFAYTQELEGQVRLFAGMFWGGLLGLVVSVFGTCLFMGPISTTWFGPLSSLSGLSLIIAGVFGWRLRRVRADEVVRVFMALLTLRYEPLLPATKISAHKE